MKSTLAVAAFAFATAFGPVRAERVAARIDGAPMYASTLEAMLHELPAEQANLPRAQLLDGLIADRLLAKWVRTRFTAAERNPGATVGFAKDVAIDDRLVSIVRRMHPNQGFNGQILQVHAPAPAMLETIFGKPGKLRLDYVLGEEQTALARRTPLLRFAIGKAAPVTLSVHDVLRRQNVQGRMEFFNHNTDFMRQQARAQAAALFVLDWAGRHYGTGPLADLRQALADHDDVRAAMTLYGVAEGAEAQSAVQSALERTVTQADIDRYYAAHKEQFTRVERVRARHIRVRSEALARSVAAMDQDFAALARRHSIAADARRGGDLGWVVPGPDLAWLASLALMQPEGKVSAPFRAPVAAGEDATWEVLLVEKRIEGYHGPRSETVRYLARKAIAQDKARAELAAAREQALRNAAVVIVAGQ